MQETNKLKDAQIEIVALEENVSALQVGLADAVAEVSALEEDLSASEAMSLTLEAELAAAEAEVSTLEEDLSASEATSLTLEGELADVEAEVSALEADLTASEARSLTLEAELAAAEAEVSTLEAELVAAEAEVLTLEAALVAALSSVKVGIMTWGYSPTNITVTVGTTVTWTNLTGDQHTASSDQQPLFDSELLSAGESYSYTFTEQGAFMYRCWEEECPNHDDLIGTVTVE